MSNLAEAGVQPQVQREAAPNSLATAAKEVGATARGGVSHSIAS